MKTILFFLKKITRNNWTFLWSFFICSLSLEKELAKLKGVDISDKHSQKIQKLKDKYDEHFDDDYGWTYKVIEKRKERNLETIFNESNLNKAFTLLYKESCKFTHSTSYSVLFKPDFTYVKRFLYASVEIIRNEFDLIFEAVKMQNKSITFNFLSCFFIYLW